MRSWKQRWKDELDGMISPLSDEVKNAPIPLSEEVKTEEKWGKRFKEWLVSHRNRVLGGVATALASVVALCIILPNVITDPSDGEGDGAQPVGPPISAPTSTVLLLEINPRVVFSVDTDGNISAVVAMNADADVILSEETRVAEMKEKKLEEGVLVFVDYAAKLGYLNFEKGSAVRLSGENEEKVVSAATELRAYFRSKGAYTAVVNETLELDAFCARAGLEEAQDVNALTQTIETLPSLYSERAAEGKTEEEMQTLYEQFVPSEELLLLIQIIEWIDPDAAAQLRSLLEFPKTFEDYTQKLDEYFDRSYEDLEKKNAEAYGQVRDEITESAYDDYIKSIEEQYGSLAAYWEERTEK